MIGYETVFITHPDLEEADLKKSLKKFKDIIKKGKGKLIHEYLWGRRRLAYQIANQNHGVYHIWYLHGTGAILDELQTQFRYSCLLYTSPSPRDRQKSRMPSSA